jgi:hypothetical protein
MIALAQHPPKGSGYSTAARSANQPSTHLSQSSAVSPLVPSRSVGAGELNTVTTAEQLANATGHSTAGQRSIRSSTHSIISTGGSPNATANKNAKDNRKKKGKRKRKEDGDSDYSDDDHTESAQEYDVEQIVGFKKGQVRR